MTIKPLSVLKPLLRSPGRWLLPGSTGPVGASVARPGKRENADFWAHLARAKGAAASGLTGSPAPVTPARPTHPESPVIEIERALFEQPVETRFAHAVDPNDLKEIRLGVRVRRAEGGFEMEAVVLDQAGRPVPDAVVLAMVDPSGPAGAGAGGFLPNTDVFGRTHGVIPATARNLKLIAVSGNGLQTAREFELPAG